MVSIDALVLMALSIGSVGLWTLRVTIAAQGRRMLSSVVPAVEAVVFAVTFSHLATDLGRTDRLIGYAVGVAIGTLIGLTVTDGLTHLETEVHVVSPGHETSLVDRLHRCGWPATWHRARGPEGDVTVVVLTVARSEVDGVLDLIADTTPPAFWTTQQIASRRPAFGSTRAFRSPRHSHRRTKTSACVS